jgi:DNA repair exonuclease SbcCD ATPase subunit
MSTEERVLQLENAFRMLVELARIQSERMDEYERRSEQLADEFDRRFGELTEAQKQTEAHISVLADVMSELGRAQTRTEAALTSLTERFEQYITSRP